MLFANPVTDPCFDPPRMNDLKEVLSSLCTCTYKHKCSWPDHTDINIVLMKKIFKVRDSNGDYI